MRTEIGKKAVATRLLARLFWTSSTHD